MERLKGMGLKRSFFLLSLVCLVAALLLTLGVYLLCGRIADRYPKGGVAIGPGGVITKLEQPSQKELQIVLIIEAVQLFSAIILPAGGLGLAGLLFYRLKLKEPIAILQAGTERIRNQDLDFSIPEVSTDELGRLCAAFETMRAELLKTNRELWRQAEERKRLNAAFSHDLRNPITVLKGGIKLLKQGKADEYTLDRLESYTMRIEQYVEVMGSIQRLEQMPVRIGRINCADIRAELKETARLLAPGLDITLAAPDGGSLWIDHGIFLTVVENLIGNASRFAHRRLGLTLTFEKDTCQLTVEDDGPGFPPRLLESGPKPFGKMEENAEHFGMGLYGSNFLCLKHGGELRLENRPEGGAAATAFFKMIKA
jgi:signal transduction histidine kinase